MVSAESDRLSGVECEREQRLASMQRMSSRIDYKQEYFQKIK